MKRIYFVAAAALCTTVLLVIFLVTLIHSRSTENPTLEVNNVKIRIEIATSSQDRERGLCCRDNLEASSGMLFVYDKPGDYRFWMKDTKIALDMYWISNEKKVVHIEKNVQPASYPKTFGTDKPAQYILETNAGFADKHNIKPGDTVKF